MVADSAAAAQVAVARRKAKQALDACRKATQRLAAADTADVYGQHTCTSPDDLQAVAELVALALTEHPRVDVVVVLTST